MESSSRFSRESIGKESRLVERIQDQEKSWRIVYRTDHDSIVILEVFRKTTQATPSRVIEDCKRRLRNYETNKTEKTKPMRAASRRKLESAGWKVGLVKDFLGLSDEEAPFVELKLTLSETIQRLTMDPVATAPGTDSVAR